jgi:hypothetical protein
VLILLVPAAASAATISFRPPDADEPWERVVYTASDGELNRTRVDASPDKLRLSDVVPILPEAGYTDYTLQRCTLALLLAICDQPEWATLELGDGNDKATVGPGVLIQVQISGWFGDDFLRGGPGPDMLWGGPGSDDVWGGGGRDAALYTEDFLRPSGVSATLDGIANDGAPGEGDNIHTDIEILVGSRLADDLVGNAGTNEIVGKQGEDAIAGGAGDDHLLGDLNSDTIVAGPGNDFVDEDPGTGDDVIDVRDGEVDQVHCGRGNDTVIADAVDQVRDCENILLP